MATTIPLKKGNGTHFEWAQTSKIRLSSEGRIFDVYMFELAAPRDFFYPKGSAIKGEILVSLNLEFT